MSLEFLELIEKQTIIQMETKLCIKYWVIYVLKKSVKTVHLYKSHWQHLNNTQVCIGSYKYCTLCSWTGKYFTENIFHTYFTKMALILRFRTLWNQKIALIYSETIYLPDVPTSTNSHLCTSFRMQFLANSEACTQSSAVDISRHKFHLDHNIELFFFNSTFAFCHQESRRWIIFNRAACP